MIGNRSYPKNKIKPLHKRHLVEFTIKEEEYLNLERREQVPSMDFARYLRYLNKKREFIGFEEYEEKILKKVYS